MLLQFFLPYLTLCHLASWGLAQNLEGLRLFKYLNTSPMQVGDAIFYPLNLNPAVGVANLSVVLTGFLAIIFVLNIRACFYLNKWVGGTGLTLWLFPGLLSMFGYMPDIRGIAPDVFLFGEGFPGSAESAAANLLMCLVAGWSLIMLLSSLWKKNTFKNVYDHIWYTMGLIAALYFVVDAGLSSYKSDLTEADDRMVRTLQLFRVAEKHLDVLCALPETAGLSPALCALAPELKWGVRSYLDMKGNVRAKIEPPNWVAEIASDPVLASQIRALNNWACTQGQQPAQCQTAPSDTALSIHDMDTPLAFPPPSYAKAIQQLHASMEKSDRRIHDIERGHNLRYFGFLIVAFLAGGKLANASRAMVKDDSVRPRSWILTTIKYVVKKAKATLQGLATLIVDACCYLAQQIAVLLARYRVARAVRLEQRRKAEIEHE
ncbi:hypothetical protein [Burkholderia sp. SIMBA_062]|uniref:hypothetical protein n=1 Tax=Burkholderia sp. SIMBA_062 TaxID=3085803 RepID=UPI00397CE96B